jgi:hypothetical protein
VKRFLFCILMIVPLIFLSACATTVPRYMMFHENPTLNISSVKPEDGKSALVVARTTSYGKPLEFNTYIEKKMIGVTKGKTYFVKTDVDPGVSYVISKAENLEPVKINFEPGRVYYLLQIPRIGVWSARTSVMVLTPEDLQSTMDDECKPLTYETNHPGDDLSDDDYRKAVNDYEREVKEGRHKDYEGYRGVPAK